MGMDLQASAAVRNQGDGCFITGCFNAKNHERFSTATRELENSQPGLANPGNLFGLFALAVNLHRLEGVDRAAELGVRKVLHLELLFR